jgi:hypothetical protein
MWAIPFMILLMLQPIQALEHPKFKEMVNIASHATNGIKIPGHKATRAEIKRTFKDHLTDLKARLNVSNFFCSVRSLIVSRVQL